MSLINIYNRKDFTKLYELFGGQEGGVGDKDGFANNAKLKDTLLGSLLNGVFRGMSWLWKKSKENYVVNKMIGRLINELLRGVIIYCLENNIDLKTGQQVKSNVDGESESESEIGDDTTNINNSENISEDEWSFEDWQRAVENWDSIDIESRLREMEMKINDNDLKDKKNLEDNINSLNLSLRDSNVKNRESKEQALVKTKEKLEIINKKLELLNQVIVLLKNKLNEKNKKSEPRDVGLNDMRKNLKVIDDYCRKNHDLDTNSDELPPMLKKIGIINPVDFKNNFKPIPSNLILIGDELLYKNGNTFINVKVNDVYTDKGQVVVSSIGDEKNNTTPIVNKTVDVNNLRPKGFPNYIPIIKNIQYYLKKNAKRFSNMNSIERQDMVKLYMIYVYMEKLIKESNFTAQSKNESFYMLDYDNVDTLYEYVDSDTDDADGETPNKYKEVVNKKNPLKNLGDVISTSGNINIKPGEPKAGKISLGDSIKQIGTSPIVGNLLTKRDKEKYKENNESFNYKLIDINLAEIEKTIEAIISRGVDARLQVAESVNPYNLKVIQLTINKLFEQGKDAENSIDNSNLKLNWDKRVSNVFASFYKMMDTNKISEILDSVKNLKVGKEVSSAQKHADSIVNQTIAMTKKSKLPIDDKLTKLDLQELKRNNYYYWFNFVFRRVNYDTVVTPVLKMIDDDIPVLKISSVFEIKDVIKEKPIKTLSLFNSTKTDSTLTGLKKYNLYIMMNKSQVLPFSNNKNMSVFLLKEIEYSNGNELFIMVNTDYSGYRMGEIDNIKISNDLLSNFDIKKYKFVLDGLLIDKFDQDKFENIKGGYGVNNDLYTATSLPDTFNTDIVSVLRSLSELL